jgi:hypothetical protein
VAPLTGRPHDHVGSAWGQGACAPVRPPLSACDPGKRRLVIPACGAPHTGGAIADVVREATGRLRLQAPPAAAPARNPPARLWQGGRRGVRHHHGWAPLREPIEAIRQVFRDRAGVTAQVRRFCGLEPPASFVAAL